VQLVLRVIYRALIFLYEIITAIARYEIQITRETIEIDFKYLMLVYTFSLRLLYVLDNFIFNIFYIYNASQKNE